MRSYQAARSLFSFIEFMAWVSIIGGLALAIYGMHYANQSGALGRGLPQIAIVLFALPGLSDLVLRFSRARNGSDRASGRRHGRI